MIPGIRDWNSQTGYREPLLLSSKSCRVHRKELTLPQLLGLKLMHGGEFKNKAGGAQPPGSPLCDAICRTRGGVVHLAPSWEQNQAWIQSSSSLALSEQLWPSLRCTQGTKSTQTHLWHQCLWVYQSLVALSDPRRGKAPSACTAGKGTAPTDALLPQGSAQKSHQPQAQLTPANT